MVGLERGGKRKKERREKERNLSMVILAFVTSPGVAYSTTAYFVSVKITPLCWCGEKDEERKERERREERRRKGRERGRKGEKGELEKVDLGDLANFLEDCFNIFCFCLKEER